MRYAYYRRLSARGRATYRKSDVITTVPLANPAAFEPDVAALREALAAQERRAIGAAARAITARLCKVLEVSTPTVRVLARRPSNATSELHGLYERHEDGRAIIRVWMRTAAHSRVVAFRTFLRTLLHEVCHHLDYDHFALADSYHTQGFFRRESHLVRQLAPRPAGPETANEDGADDRNGPSQLGLPGLQ